MSTESQQTNYPDRTNYSDIKQAKDAVSKNEPNKVEPEEREHIVDDEGKQVNPEGTEKDNDNREHIVDDEDIPSGLAPA